jgi:16S rRNA G966 N2-methylase RsmD
MTNNEFIANHKTDDVRRLAFLKVPEGVDLPFCLQQIEGWQQARKKIPEWAETEGVLYPPRLSMEQCSSEKTARYKRQVVKRLLCDETREMIDLTGGFGIDFSYLAPLFSRAVYVERQEQLCQIAQHNFSLLGITQADVRIAQAEEELSKIHNNVSLIYADPARRDGVGRKVVMLEDCQPNIIRMQEELLNRAKVVMLKLSPMLDIQQALRQLQSIREVHVVSVDGDCKELLLVMHLQEIPLRYFCVNFADSVQETIVSDVWPNPVICKKMKKFLYEPNASILKAGVQDALCKQYKVEKLHPFSHLFTSEELIADFPGRTFRIAGKSDFSKQGLKSLLSGVKQANLTVRNFPASVQELRKKLKLSEGGEIFLFATTIYDNSHVLLRCEKEKTS